MTPELKAKMAAGRKRRMATERARKEAEWGARFAGYDAKGVMLIWTNCPHCQRRRKIRSNTPGVFGRSALCADCSARRFIIATERMLDNSEDEQDG